MTAMSASLINGRYHLERLLGHGGMGSVYAAVDQRLGRPVALKRLRPDLAANPAACRRFLQEAQIAAQCRHPHIVRTFDVGDTPDGPFLVQELLPGQPLSARLPLAPRDALAVVAQLTDALRYLHTQGYVHCDLKPHNVMLVPQPDGSERAVLLDFGIARALGTDMTTLVATPEYLAPERADGAPPSVAADLYALGMLLYALLVGHTPFAGLDLAALLAAHRTAPVPALPSTIPQHHLLDQLLATLSAKAPEDRYASAAAARADVVALLSDDPHAQPTLQIRPEAPSTAAPAGAPVGPAPAVVAQRSRPRAWALVVSSLVVLLVLLFGVRAWSRGPTPLRVTVPPAVASAAAPVADATGTPAGVVVPNVIGLPQDQAQQQLAAASLTALLGGATSSDQAAGTVLATTPGPDTLVAPGTRVVLDTSLGPAPAVEMPVPGNDASQAPGDGGGAEQPPMDERLREEQKKAEEQQREEQKKAEEQQREQQKKADEEQREQQHADP